jgi:predicted ATPase
LVGREEELSVLQRRWTQAKDGAGQVVLVSGEAGIGKSRLVQALKEQVLAEGATREGATRIEFRCSPYHQNSALYPIIDHLQHLLQFVREDSPATKLEKLQHTLSHYRFPQTDTAPLLAALLSLPHPDGYPPITVSPQKQKEKTQAALVAWLMEEAEKAAVSCTWEDVHWADPSTLEVLTLLVDQVPTTRLLALLTFRPEFIPPWGNRSHLSQMTLSRLGRPHVEAMVENVTRGKALPSEVVQQIVAKTDGVPLFVEELTKTVVESGLLREEGDRYVGAHGGAPISSLAIPSTLQDSLMARLDRLAPVKEIAQLGATLGREFSYEVLRAVSPFDEGSLQQGLRQLVEVELLYQRGLPPHAMYFFKHALIQDTAYQSLLKSKRQEYHQQIARVLEEQFPDTTETQPELVAHHYTEAGLIVQALPYWQQAGERASQRLAYVEAISHLTKGLELLTALPDTPERTQQELTLQIALGGTLMAIKGYAAPEVGRAYARARDLCRQMGEAPQLFPVLGGLATFYVIRGELRTGRELVEQLLRLAQSLQNPARLQATHHGMGEVLFDLGELLQSRTHLEQAITLYDPQKRRSRAFHDTGVACLSVAAFTLWSLGYPDQALKRTLESLTLAQELSHPFSLSFALYGAAVLYWLRREVKATQEQAEALIALSHEHGFTLREALGVTLRGWALAEQGREEEGVAQIRQGLAATQATGADYFRPHSLALLAEAYGKARQAGKGLSTVSEALTWVNKTEGRWCEAELYRLKGELTLQSQPESHKSKVEEAEACFLQAIEIARQQSAKSWELRAVMSLARLWQQQGKKGDAHQMLAEIYNWFTEGFDTKDLQEAKALLVELT